MITNKTFEDLRDVHVRKLVVYGKAADHKLYYESDYKTQVTKEDAADAFNKGLLLIVDSTTTLVPVAMSGNEVNTVLESSSSVTLVGWAAYDAAAAGET